MFHSLAMSSQWSPMLLPVRGSATPGNSGLSSENLKPLVSARNLSPVLLARLAASRRARSFLP
ncbi:hypothetical protein D3C81_1845930 [compost metagenome]